MGIIKAISGNEKAHFVGENQKAVRSASSYTKTMRGAEIVFAGCSSYTKTETTILRESVTSLYSKQISYWMLFPLCGMNTENPHGMKKNHFHKHSSKFFKTHITAKNSATCYVAEFSM